MVRAALYARVSTDEQAKHGYSISTQVDVIKEYCKDKGYKIIDEYKDEGFSGGSIKRPALQKLLSDIKDKKIDVVVFTRLDRWFRSVSQYYIIQAILDANHVSWIATAEDYETVTAQGQFKVNIMLSVSQQYRDVTKEKVKESLKNKVKNGFFPSGALPFGYKLVKETGGSRLVIDSEKAPIVKDLLNHYKATYSVRNTYNYLRLTYDNAPNYNSLRALISNPLLHGEYKGIKNFCEPYLSESEHAKLLSHRQVKNNTAIDRDYIFSGLIICPCCGKSLSGNYHKTHVTRKSGKEYTYHYKTYRCNKNKISNLCQNNKAIRETLIEEKALSVLRDSLEGYIFNVERQKTTGKVVNTSKIKSELERLNELYIKGRIDGDVYETKYKSLSDKLKAQPAAVDTKPYKEFLAVPFETIYNTFSDKEKRTFWRQLVKSISYNNSTHEVQFIFI